MSTMLLGWRGAMRQGWGCNSRNVFGLHSHFREFWRVRKQGSGRRQQTIVRLDLCWCEAPTGKTAHAHKHSATNPWLASSKVDKNNTLAGFFLFCCMRDDLNGTPTAFVIWPLTKQLLLKVVVMWVGISSGQLSGEKSLTSP